MLVLVDVNETLASFDALAPLFDTRAERDPFLAATLRDGIALAAAGSFAPFARGVLGDRADAVLERLPELRLHGDVVAGLRARAEGGARVVPFTNGDAELATGWLERGGALEHVEQVLSVDEAGRWKPAPEAYAWALERCGADPAAAALVSVHPWDVHGAQRAGLRGAWLDRHGAAYPPAFGPPDVSAPHLPALAAALLGG